MPADRVCSVEWCEKAARSAGLCAGHYHRLRRYGDPEGGPNPRPSLWNLPDGTRAPCQIEGCPKVVKACGLCDVHYQRLKVQRLTHCRRGHEFTPENTYTYGDSKRRECLTCKRAKKRSDKPSRVYSPEVRAAVLAAYLNGMSTRDMRQRFGFAADRAPIWARQAGLPVRRPGRPLAVSR